MRIRLGFRRAVRSNLQLRLSHFFRPEAGLTSPFKVGNITTIIDMEKIISAANANRNFSQLLRAVREGRTYVVTSHGRPVARIAPVDSDSQKRETAKAALLKRLRSQPIVNIGPWTRDELYDGE